MTKDNMVSVGIIQSYASEQLNKNLSTAAERCRVAADQGAEIICLQELFRSPYPCQEEKHSAFDWAEPIPGPSTELLCQVAKEEDVVIIAPIFEERSRGLYHNSAAIIDADGSIKDVYRKMHIPDDPGFYEKFYFTPGDKGFRAVKTKYATIGVLICWDQWFPEGARLTALQGADILFYPTAIGAPTKENPKEAQRQFDAWETIQRSHAIANGVYVVSVNRAGTEDQLKFWGQSFVCDPMGEILEQASPDKEEIITVPCNLDDITETRRHWPFFRDRRLSAYNGLTKRWGK
jgi:N-carbamoylputrescine amidase